MKSRLCQTSWYSDGNRSERKPESSATSLKNLATFYKRELDTAIDNVIGLIEPAMIVGLGIGVGVLVASVLLPMYSLSSAIS
jgi:type IV pilus assembly protein PilC